MAQPCIQALLRAGWTPEKLLVKYGIDFHQGHTHPDLYSFTYDRTAPLDSPAVRECTGLILDAGSNWQTVARPMDAFFGYRQQHAETIDWLTVRIEEWLDGIQCTLYFHDGDWHVATKGSPDASTPVSPLSPRPVRHLFWEVWQQEKFQLPKPQMSHLTWVFQLTGPECTNVVQYPQHNLTLVGLRHKMGMELKPSFQSYYPYVNAEPLQNVPQIQTALENRRGTDVKGFIAVDRYHKRCKFYHPEYYTRSLARVEWSARKWLALVRVQEQGNELVEYFPEYRRLLVTLTEAVTRLEHEIDAAYWLVKDIPDQKDYAAAVKDLPYAAVLFSLRKGHIQNARQGLRVMPIDKLLRLAQLKKESFFAIRGVDDEAAAVEDNNPGVNDALGG